ncbi:ParA family protein [Pelagibius sp. Alg239-R121]|uniref:ParA family protein n=1 Tax=Pelagibius sp. Alg239-R121 TaxID=2993448 RepID=UPI0024A6712D|nr:ParA family protein [Pelagibius sp. Alg239-R121]
MKLIVVANSKGGAGKSLLVIGIASALHRAGKRVRVVDLDEQGTVARWFKADTSNAYPTPPSSELMIDAAIFDDDDTQNAKLAYQHLLKIEDEDEYDFVIVDTKGEAALLTSVAMSAADVVLCPTDGSSAEFEPVIVTYKTYEAALARVDESADPRESFRVVFTRQTALQANTVRDSKAALSELFPCVPGPSQSSSYNDAHYAGTTLGHLVDRAEQTAKEGGTPAIRSSAKRAMEKHGKALKILAELLTQLELLQELENVPA